MKRKKQNSIATTKGQNTSDTITPRKHADKSTIPTSKEASKEASQWADIYCRLFPTNSNLTPLSMLHCATIRPHAAFITKAKLKALEPSSNIEIEYKKSGKMIVISLQGKSVCISANQSPRKEGLYLIEFIWVDLTRLAFGHSGRVIETADEMFYALSIYNIEMNLVLEPSSKDRACPGLVMGCSTFWSRIEIPMQLLDSDGSLLRALRHAKHTNIQKPALIVFGESIRFKGSHYSLQVYRKDIQLKSKHKLKSLPVDKHTLRFEVMLKSVKLVVAFGGCKGQRLRTFTFDQLYPIFLDGMKGIEGGYKMSTAPAAKKLRKPETFIHALLSEPANELGLEDLVDLYVDTTGTAARNKSSMKKNIRAELSEQSSIPLSKIFPEVQPANKQMSPMRELRDGNGKPTGVYKPAKKKVDYSLINPRIRQVYSYVSYIKYADFAYFKDKELPKSNPINIEEIKRCHQLYSN